jgi:hypothetical protein
MSVNFIEPALAFAFAPHAAARLASAGCATGSSISLKAVERLAPQGAPGAANNSIGATRGLSRAWATRGRRSTVPALKG